MVTWSLPSNKAISFSICCALVVCPVLFGWTDILASLFTVIVMFKCMLFGYCLPVISVYLSRPGYRQKINIKRNAWAELWMINYEKGGLGRRGVPICIVLALKKSGNTTLAKVNLQNNRSCLWYPITFYDLLHLVCGKYSQCVTFHLRVWWSSWWKTHFSNSWKTYRKQLFNSQ